MAAADAVHRSVDEVVRVSESDDPARKFLSSAAPSKPDVVGGGEDSPSEFVAGANGEASPDKISGIDFINISSADGMSATAGTTPAGKDLHEELGGDHASISAGVRSGAAGAAELGPPLIDVKVNELQHLPPDFRVQLQLLQSVAQQGRILQRLEQKQEDVCAQLASLTAEMASQRASGGERGMSSSSSERKASSEADLERRLVRRFDGLSDQVECGHQMLMEAMVKVKKEHHSSHFARTGSMGGMERGTSSASHQGRDGTHSENSNNGNLSSPSKMMMSEDSLRLMCEKEKENNDRPDGLIKQFVQSVAFDILTGLVITANVVVICIQGQTTIEYALSHIGEGEAPVTETMKKLNYCFVAFYSMEILLKVWAFTCCGMLRGEDWKWNVFDVVLVFLAYYDLLSENVLASINSNIDSTWMRGLRLLKMFKMLRVVRVMRYFRELRMIIASILGSMMTLCWSILSISLMIFVFGLCFMQGVSGYLMETPLDQVSKETINEIKAYWGSVPLSCITLYMAISGGSDWEPLASPLWECGGIYYVLFLGFIALATIAVLNVVTGMFVDAAMNVAERDAHVVLEHATDRPEIQEFRKFLMERDRRQVGVVELSTLDDLIYCKHKVFKDFLGAAQLEIAHSREVFKLLSGPDECCCIEEFIAGCLKYNNDTETVDVIAINAAVRRFSNQFAVLMEYVEDEFGHVRGTFKKMNMKSPEVLPLKDRLQRARCLPSSWRTEMHCLG